MWPHGQDGPHAYLVAEDIVPVHLSAGSVLEQFDASAQHEYDKGANAPEKPARPDPPGLNGERQQSKKQDVPEIPG